MQILYARKLKNIPIYAKNILTYWKINEIIGLRNRKNATAQEVKTVANVLKLKGRIIENGYSIEEFARVLGMDYSTLYRKIKSDGASFTVGEANKIVEILKLEPADAVAIFFDAFVA